MYTDYSDYGCYSNYSNYSNYADAAERRARKLSAKESEVKSARQDIKGYIDNDITSFVRNVAKLEQTSKTKNTSGSVEDLNSFFRDTTSTTDAYSDDEVVGMEEHLHGAIVEKQKKEIARKTRELNKEIKEIDGLLDMLAIVKDKYTQTDESEQEDK